MLPRPRPEFVVIVALALFSAWATREIGALRAALAAKPRVEFRDRVVEKRVVVRGPVRIVKVKAPDGTVTTTTDRAAETSTSDKAREIERTETPVCALPKTRYVGLAAGLDAWQKPRLSAGLTFAGAFDIGAYYDSHYSAAGVESRYRW